MAASDHVARQLRILHHVRQSLLRELVESIKLDLVSLVYLLSVHLNHGFLKLFVVLFGDLFEVRDASVVAYELCQVLLHLLPITSNIVGHFVAAVYEVVHLLFHVVLQVLNTLLQLFIYLVATFLRSLAHVVENVDHLQFGVLSLRQLFHFKLV